MIKTFQKIYFRFKFITKIQGNLWKRIKTSRKYTQLYAYHKQIQDDNINHILAHLKNQEDKITLESKKKKINLQNQKLKQSYQADKITTNLTSKFFKYLSLYYESLQNLIEGRREVFNNENYKFQDNETVKEKQQKFKQQIQKIIGKISKKNK